MPLEFAVGKALRIACAALIPGWLLLWVCIAFLGSTADSVHLRPCSARAASSFGGHRRELHNRCDSYATGYVAIALRYCCATSALRHWNPTATHMANDFSGCFLLCRLELLPYEASLPHRPQPEDSKPSAWFDPVCKCLHRNVHRISVIPCSSEHLL